MLKVDIQQWGQSEDSLRQQALSEPHPRSRERLMALYEICRGRSTTPVGLETGRNPQTVMGWVHRYNTEGPVSLLYRHSGGHPPLVCRRSNASRAVHSRRLGVVKVSPSRPPQDRRHPAGR